MILINIVYNVVEEYKNDISNINLKKIINKKLLNIIIFMETLTNESN